MLRLLAAMLFLLLSPSVGASSNVAIRNELYAYINDLQYAKIRFTQTIGNEVSTGSISIDRPRSVLIEYYTPKRITISYDGQTPDFVLYYDHKLGQKRKMKARTHVLELLMEPNVEKVLLVQDIRIVDGAIIAAVLYRQERIEMVFDRAPLVLKVLSVSAGPHGKKTAIKLYLDSMEVINKKRR